MGAKPLFCLPNNQTRICNFFHLKKIKHERKQKQRQRKKNTKKREYILNEGYNFLKKVVDDKKSPQKFYRIERDFSIFF